MIAGPGGAVVAGTGGVVITTNTKEENDIVSIKACDTRNVGGIDLAVVNIIVIGHRFTLSKQIP